MSFIVYEYCPLSKINEKVIKEFVQSLKIKNFNLSKKLFSKVLKFFQLHKNVQLLSCIIKNNVI